MAQFANVPIRTTELAITLKAEEAEALASLRATGLYGGSDGEVLRYVLFAWWVDCLVRGLEAF